MHDSGVFHEDIKPHNVTYKGFGKWMAPVSLIDGGSASVGDGTQEAVPKNKAYQSPEELLGSYSISCFVFKGLTDVASFTDTIAIC
jgi:serine/threonine protein kinase